MTAHQERHGQILVVRLDRPHKRNAIDAATTAAVDEALNELEDDRALRVGIITGSPEVFSAGTDLAVGAGGATSHGGEYGIVRRSRTKPLIAAVEGPAVGGGFEIALACDLIVASTTATFALPEARRGVVASAGALFRAARALPLHVANELLLTGASLDADRARELGLVNRVVPEGDALEAAILLAAEIVASSPVSVHATLDAIQAQVAEDDEKGWRSSAAAVGLVMNGPDHREGVAAFLERRQPRWSGS